MSFSIDQQKGSQVLDQPIRDTIYPFQMKAQFGTASILQDGRVVFNVAGNKYRIVVWINYPFYIRSSGPISSTTTLTRKRSKSRAMNITPIRTKADHKAALKTIESLMDAKANTPEGDRRWICQMRWTRSSSGWSSRD